MNMLDNANITFGLRRKQPRARRVPWMGIVFVAAVCGFVLLIVGAM